MSAHPAIVTPYVGKKTTEFARPILKWAGGKRQVMPYLLGHLPKRWKALHEPFIGGGAVFFELAARFQRPGQWATLTDNNERLIRTYTAVRDSVEDVIARLEVHSERHGEDYFYEVRAAGADDRSDADLAAWMIYLNKTGFNGLYRVNSKNIFNVPFGRYVNPTICDVANLKAASIVLRGALLQQGDFAQVLEQAVKGDLVYFDPPYVPLSGTANFTAYTRLGFGPDDQERLRDVARELKKRGVRVILSNHDTPVIRELYADGFSLRTVMIGRAINSAASKRGKVAEVIIT